MDSVLVAGVLHLGSTPQQGHYRTFMAHSRTEPCAAMQELTAFSTEPSAQFCGWAGILGPYGETVGLFGEPVLHLVVYRRW